MLEQWFSKIVYEGPLEVIDGYESCLRSEIYLFLPRVVLLYSFLYRIFKNSVWCKIIFYTNILQHEKLCLYHFSQHLKLPDPKMPPPCPSLFLLLTLEIFYILIKCCTKILQVIILGPVMWKRIRQTLTELSFYGNILYSSILDSSLMPQNAIPIYINISSSLIFPLEINFFSSLLWRLLFHF